MFHILITVPSPVALAAVRISPIDHIATTAAHVLCGCLSPPMLALLRRHLRQLPHNVFLLRTHLLETSQNLLLGGECGCRRGHGVVRGGLLRRCVVGCTDTREEPLHQSARAANARNRLWIQQPLSKGSCSSKGEIASTEGLRCVELPRPRAHWEISQRGNSAQSARCLPFTQRIVDTPPLRDPAAAMASALPAPMRNYEVFSDARAAAPAR